MLLYCSDSGKFQRSLAQYSAEIAALALSRQADLPEAQNCSSQKKKWHLGNQRQTGTKHLPAASKVKLQMSTAQPQIISQNEGGRRGEAETGLHPFLLTKPECCDLQVPPVHQTAEQVEN